MLDPVAAALAAIFLVGIGLQWVAWRTKIPSILLLLVGGFAVGNLTNLLPDGLFGELLFPGVSLAVALILFEGGLSLRYAEMREVGRTVTLLVFAGVVVTGPLTAIAAHELIGFSWNTAALFGAILVVTGPTVVGPLLEQIRPVGRTGPILKWEGIVIDPVGAMLTVLVLEVTRAGNASEAIPAVILGVLRTIGVGIGTAGVAAWLLAFMLRRYMVPDQLHNPIVMMFVVVVFTAANALQEEAGLFATPMMGLLLANDRDLHVRHITEFQENLRVLLLAGLFVVLGARIEWSDATRLGWESLLLLLVSVLVIRPLAVVVGTIGAELTWRQRVFLSSMAPRGVVAAAIASLLAIELSHTTGSADRFLAEAFMMVVGTVAIYGLAAGPIAKALGLGNRPRRGILIVGAHAWGRDLAKVLRDLGFESLLVDTNRANVRQARMSDLKAEHVDVLSEAALAKVHTDEIGRVLALTSNEDLNELVASRYAKELGRSNVYVVAPENPRSEFSGRVLFKPELNAVELASRFVSGARFGTTHLTERFGLDRFEARYGSQAIPAFLLNADGELSVFTADNRPTPKAGDTLISIMEGGVARVDSERRLGWRQLRALYRNRA